MSWAPWSRCVTGPSWKLCFGSSTACDALTDALRAQQHEFANRLHTIAGLMELGDHETAARYALDISGASAGLVESITERVEQPEIAAMLLAKSTVASEHGVELVLSEDSHLTETPADTNMVLSIAGNLIDNGIEAAAGGSEPRRVAARMVAREGTVTIEVSDSGPGVPDELVSQIFTDGFTTKPGGGRRHHGIGLALVHRLVRRAGGAITVDSSGPTKFTVVLPIRRQADVEVGA